MKLILILLASLFMDANAQYAEGNYAEAAQQYEAILADQPNAEVYYNLGNAYFKCGELSSAILAYERCLRLDPTHRDARHNLQFAETQIVDRIEDNTSFFLSKWATGLRDRVGRTGWVILTVCTWVIFLLSLFGFLLGQTIGLRKSSFYIGLIALVLSIAGLGNTLSLHHRDSARSEAIITQGIVNAKSAPDKSGTDLFTLHEGTKVNIEETIGEWANIHVGNHVGWIPTRTLERI